MVALEMQAIVLAAGNGSRMSELSGERPKCLLPIGPLPLVWYPLHMLQAHGFQGLMVSILYIRSFNNVDIVHLYRSDYCCTRITEVGDSAGAREDAFTIETGFRNNPN